MVEQVPKKKITELSKQIGQLPYLELFAFREVEQQRRIVWTEALLMKNFHEKGGAVLAINDDDGLVGIAGVRPLAFDTEHFGKKIGRIGPFHLSERATRGQARELIRGCLDYLTDQGCVFVDVRTPTADLNVARALERASFYLGDTQVDYAYRVKGGTLPSIRHRVKLRWAKLEDRDELAAMTRETFDGYIDRFHGDDFFDPEKATDMYVKWLINSLEEGLADKILVAQAGKRIGGFLTLQIRHEQNKFVNVKMAEGVLAGVAPWTRGRGVYTSLLAGCLPWFADNVNIGIVVTHVDNIAVQNAWAGLGYRLVQGRYTFHWRKR